MFKKDHAKIVAPLKKMVKSLESHVISHVGEIDSLKTQREEIDKSIDYSKSEIEKSKSSITKINALIE